MAKYCANCGHELRDGDKFCAECGTPLGDLRPPQQTAQQGRWVYQTLTESLNGATFKGISWPLSGGAPSAKSGDLPGYIEQVVNALVDRMSAEGWQPDEAISPASLWRNDHVKCKIKSGIVTNQIVRLESVSVRFKRWVAQ